MDMVSSLLFRSFLIFNLLDPFYFPIGMPRPNSSIVRHPGLRMPFAAPPANPQNPMEKLVKARLLQKVVCFFRCENLKTKVI